MFGTSPAIESKLYPFAQKNNHIRIHTHVLYPGTIYAASALEIGIANRLLQSVETLRAALGVLDGDAKHYIRVATPPTFQQAVTSHL